MAKVMQCDICGNIYDIYKDTDDSMCYINDNLPNNISFMVKYAKCNENVDGEKLHMVFKNPAMSSLSLIKEGPATYDICPDCVHQVANLLNDIYQENHNKEESE